MVLHDYYRDRTRSMSRHFDDVAEAYDRWRFSYPTTLYEDIFRWCPENVDALEIGIGTGKATAPMAGRLRHIDAIDPNPKMMAVAQKNLAVYENISYTVSTLEDFHPQRTYAFVYAASSFQWISRDDRYRMVRSLLDVGGWFARFKTSTFFEQGNAANDAAIACYQHNIPSYLPVRSKHHAGNEASYAEADFVLRFSKEYISRHAMTAEAYLAFTRTYTEYMMLDKGVRTAFEEEFRSSIGGDTLAIGQRCILELAEAKEKRDAKKLHSMEKILHDCKKQ